MSRPQTKNLPYFFMTPNYLVDNLMALLDGGEVKVLLAITRQVLGYEEGRYTREAHVSLSLLEKKTGMSRPAVDAALKSLLASGLIEKVECTTPQERQKGAKWSIPIDPEIEWDGLENRQAAVKEKSQKRVAKATKISAEKRAERRTEVIGRGGTWDVPPQTENLHSENEGGGTSHVLGGGTSHVLGGGTSHVPIKEKALKENKRKKDLVGAIATDGGAGEEQDRKPATQPATVPESADLQKQASQGLPITGNGENEKPAASSKGKAAKPRKYTPEEEARRVGLAMAYGAYTGVAAGDPKAVGIWRHSTDPLADQFPDLTGEQFTAFTEWMPTAYPDYTTKLRSPQTIATYLLEFLQAPQAKLPAVGEYTAKTPIATVKAFFAKGWGRRAYAIAANKPESEWWQIANTEAEQVSNNLWGRLEHNMDARRRVLESEVGEKAKVWLAKMEASHG